MKCQKCGKALKHDSKLCPECTLADASGNSTKVRQMIFDVVVRQASALGVPWRQVCLPPMQVNNISAAEIEAELQRRIDDLSKAVASDSRHAESFVSRGILYNQLGQYQKAIEDYNTAINIDPRQARPYVARGVAYGEQGHWAEAVVEYNEAIKIDPKLVQAYIYRAAAYEQSAMKQLAEKDLRLIEELTGKSFQPKLSGSATAEAPASISIPQPAQAVISTMLSRLRDQTNYSSIIQSATQDLTALMQVDRTIVWTVSDDRLGVVNQFDRTAAKGVAVRSFSPEESKKIVLEILCRTTGESSVVSVPDVRQGKGQEFLSATFIARSECFEAGARLVAHLRFGGIFLGLLEVQQAQPRDWSQADLETMRITADMLGMIVHVGYMVSRMKVMGAELVKQYQAGIGDPV